MMKNEALIEQLLKHRDRLRAQGVEHLAIYGSRVRGDARPDSDLDLLLDVPNGRKFSLLDLIGVEHMISDTTGFETHATMRRSLEPRFARRISDDIVEIFRSYSVFCWYGPIPMAPMIMAAAFAS